MRLKRLAATGLVALAGAAATYQLATVEGVDGLLLRMAFKEDTVFSEQYSEAAFHGIRRGQSAQSVEAALGKPLRAVHTDAGDVVWHYSQSPTDTHFRNRLVVLSRDAGVVVEVFAEFYVD